jgi:hypothetical protein
MSTSTSNIAHHLGWALWVWGRLQRYFSVGMTCIKRWFLFRNSQFLQPSQAPFLVASSFCLRLRSVIFKPLSRSLLSLH